MYFAIRSKYSFMSPAPPAAVISIRGFGSTNRPMEPPSMSASARHVTPAFAPTGSPPTACTARSPARGRTAGGRTTGSNRPAARVQLVHPFHHLVRQQPEDRAGEVAGVEALHVRGGADAHARDFLAPLG